MNNSAVFAEDTLPSAGRRPDPNLERENNWEYSASIQHEIAPRVSATFAYYRRNFHDLELQNNAAISPCLDVASAVPGTPCGSWLPFQVTFDDPSGRMAFLDSIGEGRQLAPTTFTAFNRDPATGG